MKHMLDFLCPRFGFLQKNHHFLFLNFLDLNVRLFLCLLLQFLIVIHPAFHFLILFSIKSHYIFIKTEFFFWMPENLNLVAFLTKEISWLCFFNVNQLDFKLEAILSLRNGLKCLIPLIIGLTKSCRRKRLIISLSLFESSGSCDLKAIA